MHAAPGPTAAPLSLEIARSDPRNPDHQNELLARLRELRSALPPGAGELDAGLRLACTLTQYLIRMGGLGPEDVLQIVSRLVKEVELGAAELTRNRRRTVVLESDGVSTGGLRLVGRAEVARGRLLGEVMIQLGIATSEEVEEATRTQHAAGLRLGEALVSSGVATWDQIKKAVAVQRQLRA
jgi:hypothetical protein